jgi:hypothetical protein
MTADVGEAFPFFGLGYVSNSLSNLQTRPRNNMIHPYTISFDFIRLGRIGLGYFCKI